MIRFKILKLPESTAMSQRALSFLNSVISQKSDDLSRNLTFWSYLNDMILARNMQRRGLLPDGEGYLKGFQFTVYSNKLLKVFKIIRVIINKLLYGIKQQRLE